MKKSPLIEKFRKSQKAQIAFCGIGLAFSLLFVLWMSGASLGSFIPSEKRLKDATEELAKAEKSAAAMDIKVEAFRQAEKNYKDRLARAWTMTKYGDPDVELRRMVEDASKRAGIQLNSIGSVKQSKINNDLFYLDVDVSTVDTLELLTGFFAEIYKNEPELYWKRADFRHENLQNSERMIFNGTLRLLYSTKADETLKTGAAS